MSSSVGSPTSAETYFAHGILRHDVRLADERRDVQVGLLRDAVDERVALGVDRARVERVRPPAHPHEAGALLERLRPEPAAPGAAPSGS